MKQNNVIRLLFVEDSAERAEEVISLLRNAGLAVRPGQVAQEAQLKEAVSEHAPDLVFFNPDLKSLDIEKTEHILKATGKDFALCALADRLEPETYNRLFSCGVRGLALRDQPEQILKLVHREYDSLCTRRSVRHMETLLRESERRCNALLESSREAIAYVHEGMHIRVNSAYLDLFGYTAFDQVEALTLLDLIAGTHADQFKDMLRQASQGEKTEDQVEVMAIHAAGTSFPVLARMAPATFEGEPCLQVVFHAKEEKKEEGPSAEQLVRDAATGLFNRTHMLERIGDAVSAAAEGKTHQALMLVEPDNWASLIKTVGIAHADTLMGALAHRLNELLNEHRVAGRLADHSLAILLDSHEDEEVRALVEAIIKHVSEGILEVGKSSMSITVSVGAVLLGEKNANSQELLEQARKALDTAQSQGLQRSEIHDPASGDKAEAAKRQRYLEMVREALKSDGFILYQQQIISLQDSEGEFSEILLRMQSEAGEVLPKYFMPIAAKEGLMPQIDHWVLDKVIGMLEDSVKERREVTYFVKLAPESLENPAVLHWLIKRLKDSPIRPGSLVIEMPESKVLTMIKPAQVFVNGLKDTPANFALEQFGSGLNSFQILQHVDAQYLKIDRNFMDDLPNNQENQVKIAEICKNAQQRGKLTVAEWVQDAASTPLLFGFGVDFVQGNFLQEPEKVIAS